MSWLRRFAEFMAVAFESGIWGQNSGAFTRSVVIFFEKIGVQLKFLDDFISASDMSTSLPY